MGNQSGSLWRELAIFGAGALAGMLLSRVAPPLAAQTLGPMRTTLGGGDALDDLISDHREFLTILEQMEQAEPAAQRAALLLRLKRGLTKHALGEEDVVYPLLRDEAHAAAAAQRLYSEHAEMKMMLAELEELATGDVARWRERARALHELIAQHAQEEETTEFPRLREALDQQRRATISGKIYREKALVL